MTNNARRPVELGLARDELKNDELSMSREGETLPLSPIHRLLISSTKDGSDEDHALESSILRNKLTQERTRVRSFQEHIHYLKQKLAAKESKVQQLTANVESQYKLLQNYEHQRKEMEMKIASLSRTVRLLKEGCHVDIEPGILTGTSEVSGKARFELQKRREVKYLQLKSKYKTTKADFQEKMQVLEQSIMEYEDEYSPDTVKTVLDNIKKAKEEEKRVERQRVERRTLVSYTTEKHEHYQLNFREPVQMKANDDDYAAALMKRSAFGETLGLIKQDLGGILADFKRANDEGLSCLWMIFTEKHNLFRPKDDFFKQTKAALQKSTLFVKDFARKANLLTKKFTDREKTVKIQWKLEGVDRADSWCEADLPTQATLEAEAEVLMLKRRISELTSKFTERESTLELNLEKAETNLRFLQQRCLELHKAVFHSMRTVYKHRFKWTAKFQDPLRELNRAINESRRKPQALDVTFNLSLGEVVARDIELLKKFSDYFMGDSFFGADMSREKEEEDTKKKHSHNSTPKNATTHQHPKDNTSTTATCRTRSPTPPTIHQLHHPPSGAANSVATVAQQRSGSAGGSRQRSSSGNSNSSNKYSPTAHHPPAQLNLVHQNSNHLTDTSDEDEYDGEEPVVATINSARSGQSHQSGGGEVEASSHKTHKASGGGHPVQKRQHSSSNLRKKSSPTEVGGWTDMESWHKHQQDNWAAKKKAIQEEEMRKRQQTYLVEHVLSQPKIDLGQQAVVNRRQLVQSSKLRRRRSLNEISTAPPMLEKQKSEDDDEEGGEGGTTTESNVALMNSMLSLRKSGDKESFLQENGHTPTGAPSASQRDDNKLSVASSFRGRRRVSIAGPPATPTKNSTNEVDFSKPVVYTTLDDTVNISSPASAPPTTRSTTPPPSTSTYQMHSAVSTANALAITTLQQQQQSEFNHSPAPLVHSARSHASPPSLSAHHHPKQPQPPLSTIHFSHPVQSVGRRSSKPVQLAQVPTRHPSASATRSGSSSKSRQGSLSVK
eukprot:TRINITY_DN63995_c0_g2_i1.p1 TRINITY_DN63995_c0_g2~~TRINITY_DN63995_c0_g2_i1.p1  ORF type:complete len:1008 (-),score=109.85 TRINITY_DN63995_c0_g2_i1:45-3068(-)